MPSRKFPRLALTLALGLGLVSAPRLAARAFPQTQDLRGEVLDAASNQPIADARCALTAARLGPLPEEGLWVRTDAKGGFVFPGLLPGVYSLTCASVGHQPVAKKNLEITDTNAPFVEVVLPAEGKVRESVVVQGKSSIVSEQSAASAVTLSTRQLQALPLAEQKFEAALPLVPGVVRTPDGKISIKGSPEAQGLLLVDSGDAVDPVTGRFAIDLPVDAIESIEVYKSVYRSRFGGFSGGLTRILTKPPSNRWRYELNDLLPTPRIRSGQLVGIAQEDPRFFFTGPLGASRLSFLESVNYNINKQPVRGLAWPRNETKTEGFNSFTSLQEIFSPEHLLTVDLHIFPIKLQFANINSLVPQPASSDYRQSGLSVGAHDRFLLASGGVLSSFIQAVEFQSRAHGQGPENMLVTPNGWAGEFFNTYRRTSGEQEALETFQLPDKSWRGKHEMRFGLDFVHRAYSGISQSRPVVVVRPDGSTAERIDFRGPGSLRAGDAEIGGYFEDHWALNDQLGVDYGARYSAQTLGTKGAVAPRFGLVFSPDLTGKTVVRGGVGVFYDRVELLAGDFAENQTRIASLFDSEGLPAGPPLAFPNVYLKVDDQGPRVVPPRRSLGSAPYNLTWSLEADRELKPSLLLRLSYLSSRTYDTFVMTPEKLSGNGPAMVLSNTGGLRYHELESTLRARVSEAADMNFSYIHSLARGDLNTLDQIFVPFQAPVIRPNQFANLSSNVPDRFITWAQFKVPWKITAGPLLDVHSGLPYSVVDALQNYVGRPNRHRFPTFLSLDLKLGKEFRIPFLPWVRHHTLRGALGIINLTNHANPRDVFSNIASPFFGHFVGFQHRSLDTWLDILY